VQRLLIHTVLPAIFVAVPVAAAGLIAAAIPPDARRDYLERVAQSPIDWVILSVGAILFFFQTIAAWKALRWVEDPAVGRPGFDTRSDRWLSHLGQAAEWFPLLGLIGTVAAILQTFGSITPGTNPTPQEIIRKYAPAITATGSGLFMALVNILPGWIVTTGRELIASLAGRPSPAEEPEVPLTPAGPDRGGRT
jgi:hypothetical protein